MSSAWLSAGLDAHSGHLMQVTDEVARQLADLQLTLGEGPLLDASASSGQPCERTTGFPLPQSLKKMRVPFVHYFRDFATKRLGICCKKG